VLPEEGEEHARERLVEHADGGLGAPLVHQALDRGVEEPAQALAYNDERDDGECGHDEERVRVGHG